jgi:Winged helix-turn helix
MLHVDCDRWGQTPEDLRQLATSAAHQRTRERFLALYEITQASCATQVAARTRRHPQTVMEWLHLYNTHGPEALTFQRSGGRPPFAPILPPRWASGFAPQNARPPVRRSLGRR